MWKRRLNVSKRRKDKKKRKKHYPGRNRHHLVPRSRGGKKKLSNLLLMSIDRHDYWHKIFGNKTLDEVIALLQRIRRMKR